MPHVLIQRAPGDAVCFISVEVLVCAFGRLSRTRLRARWGCALQVPRDLARGKVLAVIWPLNRIRLVSGSLSHSHSGCETVGSDVYCWDVAEG